MHAVTGADGFIGSHLVELLVERGHRVRAMAQYNSFGSWGWLDTLAPDVLASVEVVAGDVRDPGSVRQLVAGADVVYHLAALIAIPYSYTAPRSYVETNVLGTLNVLEAVRDASAGRLVHTSTSETYGTARSVPISETHPLQAQSPYAASKLGADKLVESYHLSFGLPAVTLRPFTTFGPRQSARAVIPTIIGQIAAGARSVRLGAMSPTRDFLYVKDTAAAFAHLGTAKGVEGELFNAGTGEEISIRREVKIDFGVLTAADGRIVEFTEKPTIDYRVSMGVYAISKQCLYGYPPGLPLGFDELVLDLLRKGRHPAQYDFDGHWLDIGRPDDYDHANAEFDLLRPALLRGV